MFAIDAELEQKFGSWKREKNYLYNCVLDKYSNKIYLNALFCEPELKKNIGFLKTEHIEITKDISKFYEKYNGITLFSHSFVIYGFINSIEAGYTPLGLERMNMQLRFYNKLWDNNYISIGEYSDYAFCLKRRDRTGTLYVINKENNNFVKTFSSLNDLLEYCITRLARLYDENGYKIGSRGRNWMDNQSFENIF